MKTILELSGYNVTEPNEQTIPCICMTIGPLEEEEALDWLRRNDFLNSEQGYWVSRQKGVLQRKDANKHWNSAEVAFCTVRVWTTDTLQSFVRLCSEP